MPSDDIVAPPKLIVVPVKNKSFHLLDELPKLLVPLPSGTISWLTADKSEATSPKSYLFVVALYFKAKPSACADISTSPKSLRSPAPPPPNDCNCNVVSCLNLLN